MSEYDQAASELASNDAELGDLYAEVDAYELAVAAKQSQNDRYQMVGDAWKLNLRPGDPDSDRLIELMKRWSKPEALKQVADIWRDQYLKPSPRAVKTQDGRLEPWVGDTQISDVGKVVRFLEAFTDLMK